MFIKKMIKKQVKLSVATLCILAVIIGGSSYALFSQTFIDTNHTQSLNIGDLVIAFSNNSGNELSDSDSIDLNLEPMTDEEGNDPNTNNLYAFSMNNTGDLNYCYTIKLVDNPDYLVDGTLYDANRTLLSHEYIRYNLNGEGNNTLGDQTNDIIKTYTINSGENITYQLKIWIADAETYNLPDSALGSEVHLSILIEGEACEKRAPQGWHEASAGTLLAGIRKNNPNPTTPLTVPGQAVSTSSEAVLAETEDDYGMSFYYRGAVENNYVSFAGMCWRIVRIDGLGNIKLVLYNYNPNSVSNPCAVSEDGIGNAFARYSGSTYKSAFNANTNSNTYIGFMYGTPGSNTYAAEHANLHDSTILTNLKTWYDAKFSASQKAQLADTIWCNDKRPVSDTTYDPLEFGNITGLGYNQEATYYQAFQRANVAPSLKCGNSINDNKISKFTGIDTTYGNGALNGYKIGLLTIDEIAYAGGISSDINTTYYLYKNSSDSDDTTDYWWTMSPSSRYMSYTTVFVMYINSFFYSDSVGSVNAIRPAVALNPNVTISSGTGTSSSPFVVN